MPFEYVARSIETVRLLLRPFEAADLDALFALYRRPDVVRFLYEEPHSREDARALLQHKMSRRAIRADGDAVAFGIELRSSGGVVGDCMVRLLSAEHRQGEIGFALHPDHQGKGYATEAGRAMLAIAFGDLELHRVVGRLEARNAASAAVLERLGMRREAELMENEWVKGEWQSEVVYALLDREWAAVWPARAPRNAGP